MCSVYGPDRVRSLAPPPLFEFVLSCELNIKGGRVVVTPIPTVLAPVTSLILMLKIGP